MPADDADLLRLYDQAPLGSSVRSTVLDVRHETGQARGVPRAIATVIALASALCLTGCEKRGSPEQVADAFADAYFRRMDQEKAKEYTALGATLMLEKELSDVAQIRKEGYTPEEAAATVLLHRGEPVQREQRLRFPYEVIIRSDGTETIRDADVELSRINNEWKVVRVGLAGRDPLGAQKPSDQPTH